MGGLCPLCLSLGIITLPRRLAQAENVPIGIHYIFGLGLVALHKQLWQLGNVARNVSCLIHSQHLGYISITECCREGRRVDTALQKLSIAMNDA